MGEFEKERLREMKTCFCRTLDVSDSTTYTKEMIFEKTSGEVRIYSYICKSCQQTFGYYADGYIPERVDIRKFAEELRTELELRSDKNPWSLTCDHGSPYRWIIIQYEWKPDNWKSVNRIFDESRD